MDNQETEAPATSPALPAYFFTGMASFLAWVFLVVGVTAALTMFMMASAAYGGEARAYAMSGLLWLCGGIGAATSIGILVEISKTLRYIASK